MNDTKKRGRPKGFDQEIALQAALEVFWKKGYDAASLKDLTEAMGINAPSLYLSFGDKHSLYLKTIESYVSDHACAPLVAFEAEADIHRAVQAFYFAVIEDATANTNGATGCYLSSCVATTSGVVDGVQPLLKSAIDSTDARIRARFEREKGEGVLPQDFPSARRARLMFDLRQGYVLRARAGEDLSSMREDIEERTMLILSACPEAC